MFLNELEQFLVQLTSAQKSNILTNIAIEIIKLGIAFVNNNEITIATKENFSYISNITKT